MHEIEGLRLQLAVEEIIDDEFYIRDSLSLQKQACTIEQPLVYVGTYNVA